MKQQASIEIDRPIEQVFDYTTGSVAQWSLTVVEEKMIEEHSDGVGTTFVCVTEDRGRRMEFDAVVTRHDPPTVSAVHMEGKYFNVDAEYTFEDLGGRTLVNQQSTIFPKGFVKVIFLLFGWMMRKSTCKAVEKELANLKRLMEEKA